MATGWRKTVRRVAKELADREDERNKAGPTVLSVLEGVAGDEKMELRSL
jgi:uncharacterized protein (UPF0147 family)